jgi:hypothetical protein
MEMPPEADHPYAEDDRVIEALTETMADVPETGPVLHALPQLRPALPGNSRPGGLSTGSAFAPVQRKPKSVNVPKYSFNISADGYYRDRRSSFPVGISTRCGNGQVRQSVRRPSVSGQQ